MNCKIFLFIGIILLGCTQQEPRDRTFQNFDKNLVKHFPNTERNMIHFTSFYQTAEDGFPVFEDMKNAGAFTKHTYKLTRDELDILTQKLNLDSYPRFVHSEADCFPCKKNDNPEYASLCVVTELPIPTFSHERRALEIGDQYLADDFSIYVIEAKEGRFLPNDALVTNKCSNKKWTHGYSRGVAISTKRELAIFWLEMW